MVLHRTNDHAESGEVLAQSFNRVYMLRKM